MKFTVGKDDEIGLVDEIYEAKAANGQSTEESKPTSPYYPQAKNTSPVGTSLRILLKRFIAIIMIIIALQRETIIGISTILFFDLYIVMLTNGGIISMFQKNNKK